LNLVPKSSKSINLCLETINAIGWWIYEHFAVCTHNNARFI
jgi:hypothetical protein